MYRSMAGTYGILLRNSQKMSYSQLSKPMCRFGINNHIHLRIIASGISYRTPLQKFSLEELRLPNYHFTMRQCATDKSSDKPPEQPQKPGLVQRFKQMTRDYWYVLVPVHLATSAVWLGAFYYAVRSGVDVIGLLESLGISEKIIEPMRNSKAGYVALTYALYKIATPLRYTVTLGGTTYAIKKLTTLGWIRPVPTTERLKEMYQEKKENLQDRFSESTQHYQTQYKERQSKVMEEMRRYKDEMQKIKDKMRKM